MLENLRGRAARVPDWAWLAAIVTASALVRGWLARGMPAPFIFVDELVYWELARSLAETGSYSIRGVPDERLQPPLPGAARAGALGHGRPPDRLRPGEGAERPRDVARSGARMASRAARRGTRALAPRRRARGRAAVARLHGDDRHREPLLSRSRSRSRGRSCSCSSGPRGVGSAAWPSTLAAAFATRSQALGFVAALVLAPFCLALIGRERRLLRPFAPLLGGIVVLGALLLGVQAVRGARSPISSAPTASWGKAATTSATRCASGSGTSRSSRCTSPSSRSSCSSSSSPADRGCRSGCRSTSRRPSRSVSPRPRSWVRLRPVSRPTGCRTATSSSSRRSCSLRCWRGSSSARLARGCRSR